MKAKDPRIELQLDADDFDKIISRAKSYGLTPSEYLKQALEAFAAYHHPKVQGQLHKCVAAVACSVCGSAKNEPCKSALRGLDGFRYTQETHAVRRNALKDIKDAERAKRGVEAVKLQLEKENTRREAHAKKVEAAKAQTAEADTHQAEVMLRIDQGFIGTDGHAHHLPAHPPPPRVCT